MTIEDKLSTGQARSEEFLPIPKHPLVILLPAPKGSLTHSAKKLLEERCRALIDDSQTYSVTKSTINLAPSNNHFYTQAPNWWQLPDGNWEHRDGQRNPVADLPTCQKQLETMSMAVHTLSHGYKYLQDIDTFISRKCLNMVQSIVKVFFLNEETRMLPEINYSQCVPNQTPLGGNANFVVSTRYLILVSQAAEILPKSLSTITGLEDWFQSHIRWMLTSPQGQDAADLKKNMGRWYHASLASYLRILNPEKSRQHARDIMNEIITGHPIPATLFPADRLGSRPRHNTMFALEPLFILASLTMPDDPTIQPNDGIISPASVSPSDETLSWLDETVKFVSCIAAGSSEILAESDERQEAKIANFRRILKHWRGEAVEDTKMDGSAWAGGWREWSKLAWAMI